ncbi:uncharacterized protein SPPG_04548 [Spizellomyces punctatus DAOM BR117]|uniref:Uncharacterized protein n=1 Tax=Spizellomyces punctatus (strain DAOM BR117) TaxID=645134 RepID=A0A0L0HHE0_SPIPD|nr:uncharacterized protein SPPG_04548 [Spizellomyces punctatus DAOM BR117]KND00214.1 hypothetical protein SPPG_04548 [Spizellomyces punctatus DAOM BR117]|eukprot:XP_016608253.1 hypothetical protein SPPG_04548 [Spizellomyces punctatus DAOM BR117]
MGTPHGKSTYEGPRSPKSPTPFRPISGQLIKAEPRSMFSSFSGLIAGVKHTAYRGVNSILDTVLRTKATRKRAPGAINKPQSTRNLLRSVPRDGITKKRPEVNGAASRRRAELALEYLTHETGQKSEDTDSSIDTDEDLGNGGEPRGLLFTTPPKKVKRRSSLDLSESEKENKRGRKLENDVSPRNCESDRIAALERKIEVLERVLAAQAPVSALPAPPPPPPPPPPPLPTPNSSNLQIPSSTSKKSTAPSPARDPRFINMNHHVMRKICEEIKEVKLRRTNVMRSPGGTIMRTRDPDREPDEQDHEAVLAHALRKKFKSLNSESTDSSPEVTERDWG